MNLSAHPQISVSPTEVLKLLGALQSARLNQIAHEVSQQALTLLRPVYHITQPVNDSASLGYLNGGGMEAKRYYVGAASIGAKLESDISQLLSEGFLSQGMVLDAFGTIATRKVVTEAVRAIEDRTTKTGLFPGKTIMPGMGGVSLEAHRAILQALGTQNDITLTEKLLLKPLKSATFCVPLFRNRNNLQESVLCQNCSHYNPQCDGCEVIIPR
ncbi:MAG: hypothetical protein ACXAEI_15250 [Candidatus Hodarchaeales archaeon]|jgi:hypothetical protein